MKRLLLSCLWGMIFVTLAFAQTQEGRGTWYETESKGLTASHANIPFGSRVRVTNLQNNRAVIVTIDNRIADTPNRIVDLAKAAAENLEMNPRGTTPVRLEVLASRREAAAPVTPPVEVVVTPPPADPVAAVPVAAAPVPAVADQPVTPTPESPAEERSDPPSTSGGGNETRSDPQVLPSQGGPGMVNQTIITFNGMPGYPAGSGSYSQVLGTPSPTITASGGRQAAMSAMPAEPVLTAQEVPVPTPAPGPFLAESPVLRSPEPVMRSPEPVVRSPEPVIYAPQPMIMQPTVISPVIVPPVVVPPVVAPPVVAEPVLSPPILAEPVLSPPVLAEPVLAPPVLAEPVLTPPVLAEPVVTPPVLASPITTSPVTAAPFTTSPITTAPITTSPITTSPITTAPITTSPITTAPITTSPITTAPIPQVPVQPTYPASVYPEIPAAPGISIAPQAPPAPRTISVQVIPRMPDPGSGRSYRLQVGAFSNELYARDAVFRLREAGFDPAYEFHEGYCRVVLTGIRAPDVEAVVRRAGSAGFTQIFVREEF